MTPSAPANQKPSGVASRLLRGVGAMTLSPVITALIQFVTVPILLHAWGTTKYGEWLLLSAIPTYLTFSDLGFGDSSRSDMPMRVGRNDQLGALETFQSSWALVTCATLIALPLAAVFVWWMPWQSWLHLPSLSSPQAAKVILVLAAYVCVSQQNGVFESGYRSDGHFATGTYWVIFQRLAETVAATVTAILGGSLLAVAFTYLCVGCLGTIGYAILLHHLSPWITIGVRHASLQTIKRLIAPAVGFMAFPLGYALSLQGFTIVIGATLGPLAVVSFSTLRTLSRPVVQFTTVIKNAIWPELSRAFGAENFLLARRLNRIAWRGALAISVSGTLCLWVAGPYIYRLWLHQDVTFDTACFHVLLLVVVVNSLWDIGAVTPMAINGHFRIAILYCCTAAVSLAMAWILAPRLGSVGAAMALAAMDSVMVVYVLRSALAYTQDTLKDFVASLLTLPNFRRVMQMIPNAMKFN